MRPERSFLAVCLPILSGRSCRLLSWAVAASMACFVPAGAGQPGAPAGSAQAPTAGAVEAKAQPALPAAARQADATLRVMQRVADWQLAHPARHPATDWTTAALNVGLARLALSSGDDRHLQALRQAGEAAGWQLGRRKRFFADDQAIAQTWIALHRVDGRPAQLADTLAVMNDFLTRPEAEGEMTHDYAKRHMFQRWTWCDALFMAPPVLAQLYADTRDPRWEDALLREYQRSVAYLFDDTEDLFYRDHTYFQAREANGAKVFWSRGNGWVFAGLANILRELPQDARSRPYFERLFQRMARKLVALQQPDGSWHASLLDPASYPLPESSGTAFFAYGLAWGVNEGLLDPTWAQPAALKAWVRLLSHVDEQGKLGFVQPIGQDPKTVTADMTEVYGVGGFLLAGTEIRRLQLRDGRDPRSQRVRVQEMARRFQDLSFESPQLVGRTYHQALAQAAERFPPTGGIDAWVKLDAGLTASRWYAQGDYHRFKPEGGDFYPVEGGLGAGGLGWVVQEEGQALRLQASPAHESWHVLNQDADLVVWEQHHPAIPLAGLLVSEVRRLSLDSQSGQLRIASRFALRTPAGEVPSPAQAQAWSARVQPVVGLGQPPGVTAWSWPGGVGQRQALKAAGNVPAGQLSLWVSLAEGGALASRAAGDTSAPDAVRPGEALRVPGHVLLTLGRIEWRAGQGDGPDAKWTVAWQWLPPATAGSPP